MIALRRPSTRSLVLVAAVLVAFGASLSASFHFDDYGLFGDPRVTSPSGWLRVWSPDQTRPLTYFTFWLNYQLAGEQPQLYHAFNLLIHLAAVLLLYPLLLRLIPNSAAFIGAAIFAIHPIQAEPVNYIYARAALLMTLFCLLSLRSWLADRRWTSVAWFAVALLAKEECAAFPLFLLAMASVTGRGRRAVPPAGAMIALALAAGGRVIFVLAQTPDSGAGTGAAISAVDYLATQGSVILRYFRLLVLPVGFTVDPAIEIAGPVTALASWGLIAGLAVLALRWFTGLRPGFWFIGGLLLLLPSSSIFPADDLAADRRMYLPLIAFGPCIGLLLRHIDRRLLAVAGVVLLVLAAGRTQVWRAEESLWAEAVRRSPEKIRPIIQLARASEPERAIRLLEAAKSTAPDDARLASELGRRYLEIGRTAEALREFGRALALAPNDPLALNNRGVALLALGQVEAAQRDFERALGRDPCLVQAIANLRRTGKDVDPPDDCVFTPRQRRALEPEN